MKNLSLIISMLFLAGCSVQSVDTKKEEEKLLQTSKEWSEAANKKDAEKTLSYWADDAVLISPDHTLEGKDAIREMVTGSFKMPGFSVGWKPKRAVVSESGDMAYIIEDSEMSYSDSTGNKTTIQSNVVTIWRKQNGEWKNVVDISAPKPGTE